MSGKEQSAGKTTSGGGEHQSSGRNAARLRLRTKGLRLDADIRISRGGLLAIGGLVSSILLSTAILVRVVTLTHARMRRR